MWQLVAKVGTTVELFSSTGSTQADKISHSKVQEDEEEMEVLF